MNKCLLMAVAAATICATGCITVHKNDGGESNLRPCILKDRVHEKYEVSDKTVSATEDMHCLFGWITWGKTASHVADEVATGGEGLFNFVPSPIDAVKNGAYAKACEAAGCDQIVGTRYKVKVDDYFVYQKLNAEITGYPAKLTGVEMMPPCAGPCPLKK